MHGVLLVSSVSGHERYRKLIPNGLKKIYGSHALGHVNPKGTGTRNVFGQAFDDGGKSWTNELCSEDSDQDGYTNGEELGDPCCLFTSGQNNVYLITDKNYLSHPGDANSTPMKTAQCSNGKNVQADMDHSSNSIGSDLNQKKNDINTNNEDDPNDDGIGENQEGSSNASQIALSITIIAGFFVYVNV